MTRLGACWLLLLSTAFCSTLYAQPGAPSDLLTTVATYSGGTITAFDVAVYAKASNCPYQNPVREALTPGSTQLDAAQFVDSITSEILFDKYWANRAKLAEKAPTPEMVDAAEQIAGACAEARVAQRLLESITTVSAEERARYEPGIAETYVRPEQRDVQYIYRQIKPGTSDAEIQRLTSEMEAVRTRIVSSELSFYEAAKQYSDAPSAKDGGRMGSVARDADLNPRFVEFVFSLPANTVSPVRRLHNGLYIVLVEGIIPPRSAEAARSEIESDLLGTVRKAALNRIAEKAAKRFPKSKSPTAALLRTELSDNQISSDCAALYQAALMRFYAGQYFSDTNVDKIEPSDLEIRNYYNDNLHMARVDGFWKLTRFMIPVGTGVEFAHSNPASAKSAALVVRKRLEAGGVAEAELQKLFLKDRLQIQITSDWMNSTDFGDLDRELLKLPVGGLTSVGYDAKGAYFFRKDAQREVPPRPFEELQGRIRDVLRANKVSRLAFEARNKVAKDNEVRLVWRQLPGAPPFVEQ